MQDPNLYEPTRRVAQLPPRDDAAWTPPEEEEDAGAAYELDVYEDDGYDEYAEGDEYYENEALDSAHRFRVAMNVFDTVSVLVGVVVVLVLVALLASLFSWLRADVTHTFALLQTRIQ